PSNRTRLASRAPHRWWHCERYSRRPAERRLFYPDSGADGTELQTRRDALAIRAARGLGGADLGPPRRRAAALVERADGRFPAALSELCHLRLGQRRHLHQLPVERLVERAVARAAPHECQHRAGALRFL